MCVLFVDTLGLGLVHTLTPTSVFRTRSGPSTWPQGLWTASGLGAVLFLHSAGDLVKVGNTGTFLPDKCPFNMWPSVCLGGSRAHCSGYSTTHTHTQLCFSITVTGGGCVTGGQINIGSLCNGSVFSPHDVSHSSSSSPTARPQRADINTLFWLLGSQS